MNRFIIKGGNKLSGTIKVSGAKNAILPVMAACLLAPGKFNLTNVPRLVDIKTMAHLLRIIGARVDHDEDNMFIDTTTCSYWEAPYELVSKMRASIYVLGPLLARFGKAKVSFPGGCAIGSRPIDLHLMAMKKFGAEITQKSGYVFAETDKLKGNEIYFEKSSVGATANALMASVLAKGETTLLNSAIEPEIDFLVDFLNNMGAKISGKGTTNLTISGVNKLHAIDMEMMPDRIEAGTFMLAAAITKSELFVQNAKAEHLKSLIGKMTECGCEIDVKKDGINVKCTQMSNSTNIKTLPYPGFPTDLQAQFLTFLTLADGSSIIEDTIFPDRFMHVAELNRLNADISLKKNIAVIKGVKKLFGAEIMATDLRASAALVLAGLAAEGTTEISRIYHIDRGYFQIEKKLNNVGADIKRINI